MTFTFSLKRVMHARAELLKECNICKPEEGWYGQLKYCYKKQYTLF